MKGQNCYDDVDRLLEELHRGLQFEIFTAYERREHHGIESYTAEHYDGDSSQLHDTLISLNDTMRGIWFTINSMKHGKRKIEFIDSFNAIGLDLDCGKEGDDRKTIENYKQQKTVMLLNLQLVPTVIIETKNGLQPLWFLFPGEITDNDTHNSIQRMMQAKLGADPNAIGGERLYRLPGYHHWKDASDPFLCKIIHSDYNKRYKLDELTHKFGGQRKLKDLRKKSIGKRYNNKPISLEAFTDDGDPRCIADGCRALAALEQKKDASHIERFAMVTIYLNLGQAGLDHFRKIAENWNDYDENVTEYMIEHTIKQGYKPMTCRCMIEHGICPGRCVNISDKHSPIAFYYHPVPMLPSRVDERELLDVDSLPMKKDYNIIQEKVINKFADYNQTLSDEHKEIFKIASAVMSHRCPDEKPIVIPFVPGGGKTTYIIEYLRYMTERCREFGAILVVERQETITDIARQINEHRLCGNNAWKYQRNIAYPMLGYSNDDCRMGHRTYKPSQCKTCDVPFNACRVKYNFAMQKRYPVLIISQARLFEMSDRDDALGTLRFWEERIQVGPDEYETIKHPRRLLIIDEKPKLVDNVDTNDAMWDQLISDVKEFTPDHLDEVEKAVNIVRNYYSMPDEYDVIDAIDDEFRWSKDFINSWKDNYLGDYPDYPTLLRRIITEGGLFSRQDNIVSLTHYNNIYWADYNAVIFDGTAMTDPDYRDDRFIFWDLPHLRPYYNLKINVCMEQNLSKTYYQKHSDFIKKFCKDIIDIADGGITYVVSYKGYEAEFEKYLKNNNVKLEHWGNTKGRNDIVSCKNIICAGLLHKGEKFYHSKDIALHGPREGRRSFGCVTNDKVRRFVDLDTESTKVFDFLTELIQDIFRTGLRNHYDDNEINVYLCTRDVNLINLLEASFPGCIVNIDWKPDALLHSREKFRRFVDENIDKFNTNAKLVRAYVDEGNSVTTDDISEVLEISIDDAGKILRRINNN